MCSRSLHQCSISRRRIGFNASGISSQAGISAGRAVNSQSGGMTPSSFWHKNVSSRSLSQPLIKLARVFVRPFRCYVMWGVCGTQCKVHKERLVGHQRFLLADINLMALLVRSSVK